MIELSVILITKNQEWNVSRLIQSILNNIKWIHSSEVYLVDSASTDRTVEIACQFPINVLELQPSQPLTASAGRYTGYQYTSGRYVLFLDGDMALFPGWLEKGMELLMNRADAGAVTGIVIDNPIGSLDFTMAGSKSEMESLQTVDIPFSPGAALFSRHVLEKVGSFNPYLISDEEPELCLRIRSAGFKIVCLEIPMVCHYTYSSYKISTQFGRWRRGLYLGMGQVLRYHL